MSIPESPVPIPDFWFSCLLQDEFSEHAFILFSSSTPVVSVCPSTPVAALVLCP
jgi:hypothetical protein